MRGHIGASPSPLISRSSSSPSHLNLTRHFKTDLISGESMKTYAFLISRVSRRAWLLVCTIALGASTVAFCGPIHDAARKGDANKIKALLQTDPKQVSDIDKNGDTPLHVACLHGQLGAAQ